MMCYPVRYLVRNLRPPPAPPAQQQTSAWRVSRRLVHLPRLPVTQPSRRPAALLLVDASRAGRVCGRRDVHLCLPHHRGCALSCSVHAGDASSGFCSCLTAGARQTCTPSASQAVLRLCASTTPPRPPSRPPTGRKVRLQTGAALRGLGKLTGDTVRHMVSLPLDEYGLAKGVTGTLDAHHAADEGLTASFSHLYEAASKVSANLATARAMLLAVETEWNVYSRSESLPACLAMQQRARVPAPAAVHAPGPQPPAAHHLTAVALAACAAGPGLTCAHRPLTTLPLHPPQQPTSSREKPTTCCATCATPTCPASCRCSTRCSRAACHCGECEGIADATGRRCRRCRRCLCGVPPWCTVLSRARLCFRLCLPAGRCRRWASSSNQRQTCWLM